MWGWGGLGLVWCLSGLGGSQLEKPVWQTPLGGFKYTTVLKRVLFLTLSALLTNIQSTELTEETVCEHLTLGGHLTQRVGKEIGLDSLLSFIFM